MTFKVFLMYTSTKTPHDILKKLRQHEHEMHNNTLFNGTHGLRKQTLWECDIYGKSLPLEPEPIVLEPTVAILKQS